MDNRSEVKEVLNDLLMAYSRYQRTKNMRAYNSCMEELKKKYQGDRFFGNIALSFAARIREDEESV